MKQVKTKQTYSTGGNDVLLTISFGSAQMGTSRLLVNDDLRGLGTFKRAELKDVAGKTVSIKSIVTDINNQTDNVDATYVLEGGAARLEFSLEAVVEAPGASVDFNVDIEFQ